MSEVIICGRIQQQAVLTYINLIGGNENFEWRSETVAAGERRLFVLPFPPVSGETA